MRSAAVLAFTLAGLVAAQNPTTTGLKPISYPDGQFPMSTPLGLPTSSLTPIYPTTPITDSVITITDGSCESPLSISLSYDPGLMKCVRSNIHRPRLASHDAAPVVRQREYHGFGAG
jgi:hypothetical protein